MIQTALKSHFRFYLIYLGILVTLYLPQLFGDFLGDDVGRILNLVDGKAFEILSHDLGDRPLLILSIWLDKYIFHFDVLGMRFESLLYVAGIAVAARVLITELSSSLKVPLNPLFRDFALLLFVVHPLNTQAIGHVVQRGILLSTLFSLLSTYWLVKCRGDWRTNEWKWALLFWCLGLLSKPNIAFMPVWWIFLLYFLGEKKRIPTLGFFFLMLIIPVASYLWGEFNVQETPYTNLEYFLMQAKSLAVYIKLMFIPWPLHFVREFYLDSKPGISEVALWILYATVIMLTLVKSQNKGFKIFFLAGTLAFLPESSFFPIMHSFFEHRTFTPMLFLICSLAFFSRDRQWIKMSYALICLTFAGLTFARGLQVRQFENWVKLETNEMTCRTGYILYFNTHQLILREKYEDVEWVLGKTRSCMLPALWQLLEGELKLKRASALDPKILVQLKLALHSSNGLNCLIRNLSNKLLLDRLGDWNMENSACVAEDHLSHQMRMFVFQEQYCKQGINSYLVSASECLKYLSSKKLNNSYQMLKIRTILYSYFRIPDVELEKDLAESENNDQINYLRELFSKARRDREKMSVK